MRAVAAVTPGPNEPFELTDVSIEDPRQSEVLVRVTATGICHTDLSVRAGLIPFPFPAALGHEGAGVVETVGPAVTSVEPGDQVLMMSPSCGRCDTCLTGHPASCAIPGLRFLGSRLDGTATMHRAGAPVATRFLGQSSFASHALVEERTVMRVPSDVAPEVLAPFGCGFVTGAGTILRVLEPEIGDTVVVLGAGAVGLAGVAAAKLTAATRIVAVDIHADRLNLARELGATDVINSSDGDLGDAISTITDGGGSNCVLETTGNRAVTERAISTLARGGRIALVGAGSTAEVSVPVIDFISKARTISGAVMGDGTAPFMRHLIDLHRAGRFPMEKLITTYSFDQIEEAAADSSSGKSVKPVLLIPNS